MMEDDFLQKLFDMEQEKQRKKRSNEQMTLGKLIEELEKMDRNSEIICNTDTSMKFLCFNSFRGYYSDLALSYTTNEFEGGTLETVEELLVEAKSCVGKTFIGWKGGEFTMGLDTPLWVANTGHTSDFIISEVAESCNCCFISLGIKGKQYEP